MAAAKLAEAKLAEACEESVKRLEELTSNDKTPLTDETRKNCFKTNIEYELWKSSSHPLYAYVYGPVLEVLSALAETTPDKIIGQVAHTRLGKMNDGLWTMHADMSPRGAAHSKGFWATQQENGRWHWDVHTSLGAKPYEQRASCYRW